jgi:hypothetical protein
MVALGTVRQKRAHRRPLFGVLSDLLKTIERESYFVKNVPYCLVTFTSVSIFHQRNGGGISGIVAVHIVPPMDENAELLLHQVVAGRPVFVDLLGGSRLDGTVEP